MSSTLLSSCLLTSLPQGSGHRALALRASALRALCKRSERSVLWWHSISTGTAQIDVPLSDCIVRMMRSSNPHSKFKTEDFTLSPVAATCLRFSNVLRVASAPLCILTLRWGDKCMVWHRVSDTFMFLRLPVNNGHVASDGSTERGCRVVLADHYGWRK